MGIPVEKNKTYEVFVDALGSGGEGIGRLDGFTVFIEGALPGETVRALMMKVKKSYGYGKLLEIITPSPQRREPRCPVAKQCGGCQLQSLSYEAQLAYKARKVRDDLERIGGLKGIKVQDTLGMEMPWRYRNKAQFPVGRRADGGCAVGFYAKRSHRIVETPVCFLQDACNDEIVRIVREFMEKYHIPPYDEEKHIGLVRHILTRVGKKSGEIMVCIVINGGGMPHSAELAKRLQAVQGLVSVVLNVNREKTNVILGREIIPVWGKKTISDELDGLSFEISPLSFYQVNPVQTEVLYRKAVEMAALDGTETVLDLYCGIGTMSLFFARKAKRVLGVEIVEAAVRDARENAKRNGMENVEFAAGAAEDVVPEWVRNGVSADVVVVDPPRKGCDGRLLETILQIAPEKVVYVSCNPATLARDLRVLLDGGYWAEEAQPVDMFPHTTHVETVVCLSQQKPDDVIRIGLDLDELEVTPAESKATYGEIKAYVREKFGLKVSSLYISQVKRKCGLEVGENYNLAKSENAKQPQCPPEKENAIIEALRHFQMIEEAQ